MDYSKKSLELHKKLQWKIETRLKSEIKNKDDLSTVYSPWVAAPCEAIAQDKNKMYDYTLKANTVAIISDGSAVLGLWNIGAEASMPVMEWKAALFKQFGWLNAFPIILDTQDTEEIISTIKNIAPTFWWINLEDISSPRCFEIEERLKAELPIPVMHDDQHGTAIVCLAWIINSLKITGKNKKDVKIVINWVWAAGVAIAKLLHLYGFKDIISVDSKWTIYQWRDHLNAEKKLLTDFTNEACILDPESKSCIKWDLSQAVAWRDIFIWVSVADVLTKDMVASMNTDPIVFALANPNPEISFKLADEAWVKIMATWRSDYPNQINNVLVFPGIFKWALEAWVENITDDMKITAAETLAAYVENPTVDRIIPSPFDPGVADVIANAVKKQY